MKAWDQFLRDIRLDVPGCPEPVAEHAALRAAQEFFERTGAWKVWLEPIRTQPGVMEYDIELERGSELVRIERATLAGRPADITTPDALPDDWKTSQAGISDCICTSDRKTLIVLPVPTAVVVLQVEATLKPSNRAEGIEDYLYDLYVESIAFGAKARLMQQPAKPYSNPALAGVYEGRFISAMATLGIQKMRGFSSANRRSRIKTF